MPTDKERRARVLAGRLSMPPSFQSIAVAQIVGADAYAATRARAADALLGGTGAVQRVASLISRHKRETPGITDGATRRKLAYRDRWLFQVAAAVQPTEVPTKRSENR